MRNASEGATPMSSEMSSEMTRTDFIVVLDYHDDLLRQLASGALTFDEFLSLYDNFYSAFGLDGAESDEAELKLFAELQPRIAPHQAIWETILTKNLGPAETASRLKAAAATLSPA
jgi:hypothetical protein